MQFALAAFTAVCAQAQADPARTPAGEAAYGSTYRPLPAPPLLFVNANILDGAGRQYEDASLLIRDGRVAAIGNDIAATNDVEVVDAAGKWITAGIVDAHSHMGAYPLPVIPPLSDGNEVTDPNTAELWVEHSIWPQDPGFSRARAGGVTTLHVLPGSTNLFGGRSVVLKNVRATTVQGMKYPGAGQGLKMVCGENPKTVYGARGRAPSSRMGSIAAQRAAWARAVEYRQRKLANQAGGAAGAASPPRDLELETLAGALDGSLRVHIHCYRADELGQMIAMANEFGYRITTFEHAVEAYKVADLIRDAGICVATWGENWGMKMEMYDGIRENAAMVHAAGGCAIIHSDSWVDVQQLNQEAARAMYAGRKVGLDITPAQAWTWISGNPARALGIDSETGSLVPGKAADLVLWSGDPFSVYTVAERVLVDGAVTYQRGSTGPDQRSDFELGHRVAGARP